MERIKFIRHNGKGIIYLDYSSCDVGEMLKAIEAGRKIIALRPGNSLLTLTDVTNARFNAEVSDKMKEYAAHNKPYVKASAVVGITGLKKIILDAVMLFSKRKFHTFDTIEQAKDWLATN